MGGLVVVEGSRLVWFGLMTLIGGCLEDFRGIYGFETVVQCLGGFKLSVFTC